MGRWQEGRSRPAILIMNITNSEYYYILKGLKMLNNFSEVFGLENPHKEIVALEDKLKKEYDRLAELNDEEGLTYKQSGIYPSKNVCDSD